MSVASGQLNHTLRCLSRVVPVTYRRIFDGLGLYCEGRLFALLLPEGLYFRTDEDSVQPYRERGMPRLAPPSVGTAHSHFYRLPDGVLENSPELLFWMRAAVEASQSLPPNLAEESREGTPPRYQSAG